MGGTGPQHSSSVCKGSLRCGDNSSSSSASFTLTLPSCSLSAKSGPIALRIIGNLGKVVPPPPSLSAARMTLLKLPKDIFIF